MSIQNNKTDNMNKVYVVTGHDGYYDDCREITIAICDSPQKAD